MNILIALLLLSIIIFIHELGHFLAARWFKIPVQEFAIGMGPEIYSYYTGKTLYSIRAIPVGGYVNIEGMELDSKVENGFNTKTPLQRFIVLIAGIFMNFLLAFIIVLGMSFSTGKITQNEAPIIGTILEDTNAYNVLKKGDLIESIEGRKIEKWNDIYEVLKQNKKAELSLKIRRENNTYDKKVLLTKDDETNKFYIGILPSYKIEKFGFIEVFKESWNIYCRIFMNVFEGLKNLVIGKVSAKEIIGPIGIVKVVGDVSQSGNAVLLFGLAAIISINVGIFNFLPFPALDGGRLLFVFLEIIGIKVNKALEEKVHRVGLIVLFGVFIFATFNDILKI